MSNKTVRLVENGGMDKKKALEAALGQIERAFGKGSIMRLGDNDIAIETEVVSTGSIGLDIGLGIGGFPRGRVVEIYGPESSGKTTLALHAVAEAQKNGGSAAFIDAEHAQAGRQYWRLADCPARHGRAGPGNRRYIGSLQLIGRHRNRQRCRIGASG